MEAMLNSSVIVALLGLVGVIVKMYFTNQNLRHKNCRIEIENNDLSTKLEDVSLGLELDIKAAQELEDIVTDIFVNTKVDRFLVISATNGTSPMKYATVLVEKHQKNEHIRYSLGASKKYIGFEFDSNYRDLLTKTEIDGMTRCGVNTVGDGDYRNIMENEKINFANWYFLKRSKLNKTRDMMFYISMATHSDEPFTSGEEVILKASQSKLQVWLKEMNERNENLAT